jgi:hypothetical protein
MEKIIKFLLGEADFDGVWFGEKHPTEKGAFWWRKYLKVYAKQNSTMEWISVKDRLPEGRKRVLIYYCGFMFCLFDGKNFIDQQGMKITPTHYRPLPPPPKNK